LYINHITPLGGAFDFFVPINVKTFSRITTFSSSPTSYKIIIFSENVLQKIQTNVLPKTSYHFDMEYAWV